MAGRHPFEELRSRMSPEARVRSEVEAKRLDLDMDLVDLRHAVKSSQDEIGHALRITPGSVAEMEERTDIYVSTVRRFVEAMGGELEIVARFADHPVLRRTPRERVMRCPDSASSQCGDRAKRKSASRSDHSECG